MTLGEVLGAIIAYAGEGHGWRDDLPRVFLDSYINSIDVDENKITISYVDGNTPDLVIEIKEKKQQIR